MVDTNVLIYANQQVTKATAADLALLFRSSELILSSMKAVRVAPVAWAEYLRHITIRDQAKFDELQKRLKVDAMTLESAKRTTELLQKRNGTEKVCDRCLGTLAKSDPCETCKRDISRQQRMNDAMIAAVADTTDGVDVLYAFDKGVLAFAPYMERCKILRPPHPDGQLFEKAPPMLIHSGPGVPPTSLASDTKTEQNKPAG